MADRRPPRDDEGIGGFLLLFVVMQAVAFVLDLVALRGVPGAFAPETWALGALSPLYRPLVTAEAVGRVAAALLPIAGFVLTFRRSPHAPRFWIAYLLFCVAYGALELLGTRLVAAQLSGALLRRGESTLEIDLVARDAALGGVRTIAYGLIWMAYWASSDRVAITFRRDGAAAHDVAAALPPR